MPYPASDGSDEGGRETLDRGRMVIDVQVTTRDDCSQSQMRNIRKKEEKERTTSRIKQGRAHELGRSTREDTLRTFRLPTLFF